MFDGFLRARATGTGGEFVLFDPRRPRRAAGSQVLPECGLRLVQVVAVVGVGHASPLRNASSILSTGRTEARTARAIGAM
jgi:hypothetical protein